MVANKFTRYQGGSNDGKVTKETVLPDFQWVESSTRIIQFYLQKACQQWEESRRLD